MKMSMWAGSQVFGVRRIHLKCHSLLQLQAPYAPPPPHSQHFRSHPSNSLRLHREPISSWPSFALVEKFIRLQKYVVHGFPKTKNTQITSHHQHTLPPPIQTLSIILPRTNRHENTSIFPVAWYLLGLPKPTLSPSLVQNLCWRLLKDTDIYIVDNSSADCRSIKMENYIS